LYEVPFSLRSVIDETMEILAVKAKEKDVDLHVHYATNVPHHYIGDAARYVASFSLRSLVASEC
jgi:signal transduction histidine kinase